MRDLRCIVVDDEPLAVKMVETFIERTPGTCLEGSFTDPVTALGTIKEKKPDLVFLDIQMPDLNGLDLSHMIPEESRIIFTTAFKQYAYDSYEVSALDFLLKPIRYKQFLEAVEKGKKWFEMKEAAEKRDTGSNENNEPEFIFLKAEKAFVKVYLSDIIYVLGMKDYVMVHLKSREQPIMTHITMKAIEDMLPKSSFMRIHRSYIVALDSIDSVLPGNDILIGKDLIHISDAYKDEFFEYLKSRSI